MQPLNAFVQNGQQMSLLMARHSQAMVIEGVARAAGGEPTSARPRLIGRAWRLQLRLASRLTGDPAQFVDAIYSYTQHVVGLHQEFVHRILEALEGDEAGDGDVDAVASVIPLAKAR